jgi:hypothetical protein
MPQEFKIKCEDFWLKREDPRRDQLFRKMHPLIFLKEELPAYIKIQNNWVFQFLSAKEKKDYLQTRKPQYLAPAKANYDNYMESIVEYALANPNEEILSLQTFACHGIISEGSQKVLINKHDEYKTFYETIHVETSIRLKSLMVPKVYFLVLFACCREGYTHKQLTAKQALKVDIKPANFTMLFGCDPASGVPADTQLVKVLV